MSNRILIWILTAIIVILMLSLSFKVYECRFGYEPKETVTVYKSDTIYRTDTICRYYPKVISREIVRTVTVDLNPEDTITDTISYDNVVYGDSTYTAYISGFIPKLDSIKIYPKTEIIRDSIFVTNIVKEKKKKWSFGISAGYGMTLKSLSPFIGITVTRDLFSF